MKSIWLQETEEFNEQFPKGSDERSAIFENLKYGHHSLEPGETHGIVSYGGCDMSMIFKVVDISKKWITVEYDGIVG